MAEPIQRYELEHYELTGESMCKNDDGEWVLHMDHIARIDAAEKRAAEEKQRVTCLTQYLVGVMHSVDKWLDERDVEDHADNPVHRAAMMRERTLRLLEESEAARLRLAAENKRLREALLVCRTVVRGNLAALEMADAALEPHDAEVEGAIRRAKEAVAGVERTRKRSIHLDPGMHFRAAAQEESP